MIHSAECVKKAVDDEEEEEMEVESKQIGIVISI